MKQDLTTSIFAAVVGALVAYFVCNMFLPELQDVTFTTLSETEKFTLAEPDSEVFNYRSVNPPVEVYVGNCVNLGENGVCNDDVVITDGGNGTVEPQPEEENQEENEEENKENENQEQHGDNENGTTN